MMKLDNAQVVENRRDTLTNEAQMGQSESPSEVAYILEVLGEAGQVVQEIPVSGYLKIGRGSEDFKPDVLIPPEFASASREHAGLDLRENRLVLEDLSRYGTSVNGVRLEHDATKLSDRDEILFGMATDGWRVRFRHVNQGKITAPADPLEMLVVSDNPRQVRIGPNIIEEQLGRDAFHLIMFLSERKGSWYPTDRLISVLWPDADKMPLAPNQALARGKKRVNDLLRPDLNGQDAIISAPFRGYCMKPRLDSD